MPPDLGGNEGRERADGLPLELPCRRRGRPWRVPGAVVEWRRDRGARLLADAGAAPAVVGPRAEVGALHADADQRATRAQRRPSGAATPRQIFTSMTRNELMRSVLSGSRFPPPLDISCAAARPHKPCSITLRQWGACPPCPQSLITAAGFEAPSTPHTCVSSRRRDPRPPCNRHVPRYSSESFLSTGGCACVVV